MINYTQTLKDEWSFAGEKLLRGRHKIHPYPAMLHPLLVDAIIKEYANANDIIFDPFCGSGVVLLQASTHNHKSIGFDINPLALLIAKVKTRKYNIKVLLEEFDKFKTAVLRNKKKDIPNIANIEYWYTKNVINDLGRIRYVLINTDFLNKDFFVCIFALICRNQSLTRNGEFKRYRIEKEKINNESKVIEKIFNHIEEIIEIISLNECPLADAKPILFNSENKLPNELHYDLVITSPPYGDSRTTVAYGEYSSFGSEWIMNMNSYGDVEYKIDKETLGKKGAINSNIYNCEPLNIVIEKIKKESIKRSQDVIYFFNGYYNVIHNITDNLAKNGKVCFVVGNRTVKGQQIPMDQITASFLENFNMQFENIYIRNIHNKIMPLQNSPTNIIGKTSQTMLNEYIIVCKKV